MDCTDKAVFSYLTVKYLKEKKKKRKWWMHPNNTPRLHGSFQILHKQLREDESKFRDFFRMSPSSFDELLSKIRDRIKRRDTNMRRAISPEEMLAITLRYLGSGCSLADLQRTFYIGFSTGSRIIRIVCKCIWATLKDECFPPPNEQTWKGVAADFANHLNFPNCIGAVDAKLLRVTRLSNSDLSALSVVLLAASDSNYYFTYIEAGLYGENSGSFKNSTLWRKMEDKSLKIPSPGILPESATPAPFVFLGDKTFFVSKYLIRPYGGNKLTENKIHFNFRLLRARRCIDITFAILTSKWHILHKPINVSAETAVDIVRACCTLHNFVRKRDGFEFEDMLHIIGLEEFYYIDSFCDTQCGKKQRDIFTSYFSSDAGKMPPPFRRN